MDQGRGLERLAGRLAGQPLRRQLAQLVIDKWKQLLRRLGSACSIADRMRVTSFIDIANDSHPGHTAGPGLSANARQGRIGAGMTAGAARLIVKGGYGPG